MTSVNSFRERHLLDVLACLAVLLIAVFLPAALRYQFTFNSLAPGVLVSCILLAGLTLFGLLGRMPTATLSAGWTAGIMVLIVVLLHLGLSLFQWAADLGRAVASLGALGIMLGAVPVVFWGIFRAQDRPLEDALSVVRVALLVMVVLSMIGLQPVSDLASERPVWPFTEPSHFALAAAPFFMHGCIAGTRAVRWLWLAAMLGIVLALKSVSLGVALVLTAVACLSLLELAVFAIAAGGVLSLIDLTYFTDRLAVSHDSSNLSALIYLQGVELIQEAIGSTHGWGLAFQQLGFAPTNVLATEMIKRAGGGEQNLADGSFLAVKLGAEFGVLGLAVLLAYLFRLVGVMLDLRLIALRRAASRPTITFALCVFACFFVELFVRGVGYFSNSALLAFASFGIVARLKVQEVRDRPGVIAHAT